jgi:glycerol transport system ATP-binding protein
VGITGTVTVNEISGSESFIHFGFAGRRWVALVQGIQAVGLNESLPLYLDPENFYYFHNDGQLALAPGV